METTEDKGILDVEEKYFQAHLSEWLQTIPGKFVVIHGEELGGFYDSGLTAYHEGMARFGFVPMLIREVRVGAEIADIPVLATGLFYAHV
jgi:hypothetical protein